MNIYIVKTTSTCYSNYYVAAESQEEAEEKFWDGEHDGGTDVDWQNENVYEVKDTGEKA